MPDPSPSLDERPQAVIVKFRTPVPYQDGLEKHFARQGIAAWKSFVRRFPDCTFLRVYRKLSPEQVQDLIARAAKRDQSPMASPYRDLLQYFIVKCPDGQQPEPVMKALLEIDTIETAYVAATASDPVCLPWAPTGANPRRTDERYLNASTWGIDAAYAWSIAGGDGCGQDFIDLEQGWTLDHDELAHRHITGPLFGAIENTSRRHGTAVLAIVCGADNPTIGVGIVPNLASVNVVAWKGDATHVELPGATNIPDAIAFASNHLSAGGRVGGVLLLEVQVKMAGLGPWLPCEIDPLICKTIQLAVALGVVVVEAAGNGGTSLDTVRNVDGLRALKRNVSLKNKSLHKDFVDSGAIMVGAARFGRATPPKWPRHSTTNYGTRIDCFAHGERICTAGSNPAGDIHMEITDFGGTSGASAIIAGAALSVQGMTEARRASRLLPSQVRGLLATQGTPAKDPGQKIGVMPDLRKIEPLL